MPSLPRRVQLPSSVTPHNICTREDLGAAMACPDKSPELLSEIIRSLVRRSCTRSEADAWVGVLLREPALDGEHLYLLILTLANRVDAGLEPARIAMCSHPLMADSALTYALWKAPTPTLVAVADATSRLVPNAVDWGRRKHERQNGRAFLPLTGKRRRRILTTVARWEELAGGDRALRAFVSTGSFLFTDQVTMFAAGRAITAAPLRRQLASRTLS